jgi:hypothetical protein
MKLRLIDAVIRTTPPSHSRGPRHFNGALAQRQSNHDAMTDKGAHVNEAATGRRSNLAFAVNTP